MGFCGMFTFAVYVWLLPPEQMLGVVFCFRRGEGEGGVCKQSCGTPSLGSAQLCPRQGE